MSMKNHGGGEIISDDGSDDGPVLLPRQPGAPDPATYDHEASSHMTVQQAIVPVQQDPSLYQSVVVQHLAIDIANNIVELAQVRARVGLVLQAYEALHSDTWVRQVVDEPSMIDGKPIQFSGPILVPAVEQEALSRFLAAVEALR